MASESEPVPDHVVRQIDQLVAEFAYRVDFLGGLTVAELFVEDGFYESDGQRSTGRVAIAAAYELRAARGPRTSRHLFTNLRVLEGEDSAYSGTSIMLLFAHDGNGPHPAEPLLVADVEDVYSAREDGRLKILSRRLTTVFVDPLSEPVLPLGHEVRRP